MLENLVKLLLRTIQINRKDAVKTIRVGLFLAGYNVSVYEKPGCATFTVKRKDIPGECKFNLKYGVIEWSQ